MRWIWTLALCLLPMMATAQEDDRSTLEAFLEDNLSGAGREVTVTGFSGALSSTATIERLTIADDQGVWLTMDDVVLDWRRSALLRGQVSISTLTAGLILIDRAPVSQPASGPAPEAGGFALPELPVSIDIGKIAVDKIVLGQELLGERVEAKFSGTARLAGGEGATEFQLERTDDGPAAQINLTGAYSNETRRLIFVLNAQESEGGIVSGLLRIPGQPAIDLSISGDGPVDDFTATVLLASDGQKRLSGTVRLHGSADGMQGFGVDLQGDLAPLFLPEYADFFGSHVALVAEGKREASGRLELSALNMTTRSLNIQAMGAMTATGRPERFGLVATIADPTGKSVQLPATTDAPVLVQRAELTLGYDATQGEGWSLNSTIDGLDVAGLNAQRLTLSGSGRINAAPQVGGTIRFAAQGLQLPDPAVQRAVGDSLTGEAKFSWKPEDALRLPKITLAGADYGLTASAIVGRFAAGFPMSGRAEVQATDISRFSDLAGQPLSGALRGTLEGGGVALGGSFDLEAKLEGQDLRIGQDAVDGLLQGQSQIILSAKRDETGTELRKLDVKAQSLNVQAAGRISTMDSNLTATVAFGDMSVLGSGFRGSLTGKATAQGPLDSLDVSLTGQTRGLAVGQPELDLLLAGQTDLLLRMNMASAGFRLQELRLENPQLRLVADGSIERLNIDARLANLGLILPDFPGELRVSGTAAWVSAGYDLDLRGTGPGGLTTTVQGRVATNGGSADLAIAGSAEAGLANPFLRPRSVSGPVQFDLRLRGPMALTSLSGPVTLTNGRFSDPDLPFSLTGISGRADLSNGQARTSFQMGVSSGGQVSGSGTVGLAAPFDSTITASLINVVARDPRLYETRMNGDVAFKGPLLGGALLSGDILLAETELRIPSTGFGANGLLPDLQHMNEPTPVRETRARAGLLEDGLDNAPPAQPFALDLRISAPERLFLRGRGLDAELGGDVRLQGTTADVQPSGSFTLIRGRLDILGKRLDLTEASMQLEGSMNARINILASTTSDGVTSSVRISGLAMEPEVTFESVPELPEEEVLARLLFGRDLTSLSAFQAAQLASAVATLAGRGGEGIISRLRNGFGLDDLDVETTDAGGTVVRAGKYISRNAYTQIELGDGGSTEIQLNLDVTDNLTARGTLSNDGGTGLGLFFERDY